MNNWLSILECSSSKMNINLNIHLSLHMYVLFLRTGKLYIVLLSTMYVRMHVPVSSYKEMVRMCTVS